jgi:hypothetical protein
MLLVEENVVIRKWTGVSFGVLAVYHKGEIYAKWVIIVSLLS